MNLLKMCGPQIRLYLFTFRTIASKQLNSSTSIDTLSWLGAAVVTHPLWVHDAPGQFPAPARDFKFDFLFCFLLMWFYFLSKNTLFVVQFCNSFFNGYLFSLLNILQDFCSSIKVYRYRPSIFNSEAIFGCTV